MNGRVYDPIIGRFLSPDNNIQMPYNSQNFNRYSYCMNNPLKYVDPDGEFWWLVAGAALVGGYIGASVQSGSFAFWNWKSDAWKGAITGAFIGASVGLGIASGLGVNGVASIGHNGVPMITKTFSIASSIINGGTSNMLYNMALNGGRMDDMWKTGLVGTLSAAWAYTGGFGLMKNSANWRMLPRTASRLLYQSVGTIVGSIGTNWINGEPLFSKIVLGLGPVNLTFGKGQNLFQIGNNLGNLAVNGIGIVNLAFGGKIHFNIDNATAIYNDGFLNKTKSWGPYAILGAKDYESVLNHEMHHIWQSRALADSFLFFYLSSCVDASLITMNNGLKFNPAFYVDSMINSWEFVPDFDSWW